jgi:hypothetical protein
MTIAPPHETYERNGEKIAVLYIFAAMNFKSRGIQISETWISRFRVHGIQHEQITMMSSESDILSGILRPFQIKFQKNEKST